MLKFLFSLPRSVTDDKLLKKAIALMKSLEWPLIQYGLWSYKKRNFGHRQELKEDDVKTQEDNRGGRLGTDPSLMALKMKQPH